jgi:hypothetical protein
MYDPKGNMNEPARTQVRPTALFGPTIPHRSKGAPLNGRPKDQVPLALFRLVVTLLSPFAHHDNNDDDEPLL